MWVSDSGTLPDAALVCFDTISLTASTVGGWHGVPGPASGSLAVTEVKVDHRLSCGQCGDSVRSSALSCGSASLAMALVRADDELFSAYRGSVTQALEVAALKRKLEEQARIAAEREQALRRELIALKDAEVGLLTDVVLGLSTKLASATDGAAALTAKQAQLLRHMDALTAGLTAMKDYLCDEGHISASTSPPEPTRRADAASTRGAASSTVAPPTPAKLQWTDRDLQEYSAAAKPSPEETARVEAIYAKVEAAFAPPPRSSNTAAATPPPPGTHSPGGAPAGNGKVAPVSVPVPYPRIVRGGSAAKGTAVKGKSDVDIVAIVPDFNPAAMATCKCITSTSGRPSRTCHQRWTRLETRGTIGSSALLGRRDAKPAKEANFAIVSSLTPPAAWGLWTVAPPIPGTGTPSS